MSKNQHFAFKSGIWRKSAIILSSGVISVILLAIIAGNSRLNGLSFNSDSTNRGLNIAQPKNQTGPFTYTSVDPNQNGRCVYSVRAANLLTKNSRLGIFKTSLYKVIKITDFELTLYQYSCPFGNSQKIPASLHDLKAVFQDLPIGESTPFEGTKNPEMASLIQGFGGSAQSADRMRINFGITNTIEILIDNFDYKVLRDGNLVFELSSKKASLSYRQAGLLLRGHATMKTANAKMLECNSLTWDIGKGQFVVNGTFIISGNGLKTAGSNIRVDAQLNEIKTN